MNDRSLNSDPQSGEPAAAKFRFTEAAFSGRGIGHNLILLRQRHAARSRRSWAQHSFAPLGLGEDLASRDMAFVTQS